MKGKMERKEDGKKLEKYKNNCKDKEKKMKEKQDNGER